jgi:hypothetical protein
MKRITATAAGLVIGIVASLGLQATIGRTAPRPPSYGPAIGPVMSTDTGASELLLVVSGGTYSSRADAEVANDQMPFGDVAGFYVVPVAQFQGFKEQVGTPGDFALVSVFRTELGAQEFVTFAESLGYPATILPDRVRSLGGLYAGLGQEADPNGLGPLTHPIPESLP